MAVFSRPIITPGSLSNMTQIVNTTTTTLPLKSLARPLPEEAKKESRTDVIFAWAILGAILVAFVGIVLADVYRKHKPKRNPNSRSFVVRGIGRACGRLTIGRNGCISGSAREDGSGGGGSDIESAAAEGLDPQAITDQLAGQPAGVEARAELSAETNQEKWVGPAASLEVVVTALEMPFLQSAQVAHADGK
ncbi:hypothetical protein Trco_002396 [Trichoderma cornu-damae]|uniref:Uncharacterized protein n=1 Tax=Trichoderma cornu-damae TaxID=654480 RepID=A0A9P8QMK3_9HYPO|nr:hypothetical protein Trco_002396 [Trichoderma cornu-damae]